MKTKVASGSPEICGLHMIMTAGAWAHTPLHQDRYMSAYVMVWSCSGCDDTGCTCVQQRELSKSTSTCELANSATGAGCCVAPSARPKPAPTTSSHQTVNLYSLRAGMREVGAGARWAQLGTPRALQLRALGPLRGSRAHSALAAQRPHRRHPFWIQLPDVDYIMP